MIGGSLFLAPFKSVRWYDICHLIDFFSMPFIGRYAQTFISMYYTSHQLWFNGLLTITLLHIYTLQKYRKLKRNRIVACKTCPIICKELFDVKYWIKQHSQTLVLEYMSMESPFHPKHIILCLIMSVWFIKLLHVRFLFVQMLLEKV